jgi:hypothetical protein
MTPISQSYIGRRLRDLEDHIGSDIELVTQSTRQPGMSGCDILSQSDSIDVSTTDAPEPFIGAFCDFHLLFFSYPFMQRSREKLHLFLPHCQPALSLNSS